MIAPTFNRIADAKYKHFLGDPNGDGCWLTCDRPFDEVATDIWRDAIHASKPVAMLGKQKPRPVHTHRQPQLPERVSA